MHKLISARKIGGEKKKKKAQAGNELSNLPPNPRKGGKGHKQPGSALETLNFVSSYVNRTPNVPPSPGDIRTFYSSLDLRYTPNLNMYI